MALPINMLRKLPIRKTQKLGLVLVFSVCILTIALELFRFIKNLLGDDSSNNILYAIINANLTIVISLYSNLPLALEALAEVKSKWLGD